MSSFECLDRNFLIEYTLINNEKIKIISINVDEKTKILQQESIIFAKSLHSRELLA